MKNLPSIYNETFSIKNLEKNQIKVEKNQLLYKLLTRTNLIDLFSKKNQEIITKTVLDYTANQRKAIESGALELMQRKDGALSAILIDTKTKKIVEHVPLKEVNIPQKEMRDVSNFTTSLKLNEIVSMLEEIQKGIQDILFGLHNDRLAKSKSVYSQYLMLDYMTEDEKKLLIPMLISKSSESFFQLAETFQHTINRLKQNDNVNKLETLKNYLSFENQNLSDDIFIQFEALIYSTIVRHNVYKILKNKSLQYIPINDLNIFLKKNISTEDVYLLNEWTDQNINFWTDNYGKFVLKLDSNVKQLNHEFEKYLK